MSILFWPAILLLIPSLAGLLFYSICRGEDSPDYGIPHFNIDAPMPKAKEPKRPIVRHYFGEVHTTKELDRVRELLKEE